MPASNSVPAVGIDLGTTHSVIACLDREGKPSTVQNREGDATTPSVVYFDPASPIVGKEAIKAGQFEPELLAQFAKRDVGRSTYQKAIRGEKLPPEVVQALILEKLAKDARRRIGDFRQVVVTVPAFFNEPRRKSTQDAGRLAGLDVLDIINEPTAAAIAFGVQAGFLNAQGEARSAERILIYDLGGGTFDATLMNIDGRDYNALATVGDVYLGGIDWDQRIIDHVSRHFLEHFGSDPRQDPASLQQLRQEAEDAKHALSARDEVPIHFRHQGQHARLTLTRIEFESLTKDLLERTRFTVNKLLRDAGMEWGDLTRVILVGGSTRMPMIERMLERESRRSVDTSLAPDEAVAHGAALYAGLLTSTSANERLTFRVRNVNSHDLGVMAVQPQTGRRRRKVLIPRNTPLPASGASRFVTQRDGQQNVKVDVVEGGDDSGNGATAIGKCVIEDLPPSMPTGTQIDVWFSYSENGRLTVRAKLPDVGRQATLYIERASGLSDHLLRHWEKRMREGLQVGKPAAIEALETSPASSSSSAVDDPQTSVEITVLDRQALETESRAQERAADGFILDEAEPEPPPVIVRNIPPQPPQFPRD